jgi:hypothetical protein
MDMHYYCMFADDPVARTDCHNYQMRALLEASEDIVASRP